MAHKYKINETTDVLCQSLTFGYMYDVENNIITEEILTAIIDGSDLDENGVRALTRIQVNEIWEIIKRETYPELYNTDGTMKTFDDDDDDSDEIDKKKV